MLDVRTEANGARRHALSSMLLVARVVVLVSCGSIGVYNRLVGLRNQTQNGWKQIDVQLKRRHDLIPNLVNTVKGAMEFERTRSRR